MIIRIWSFLTGGRLVWLRDSNGSITLAIARKSPFGGMIAERHWPWSIWTVELGANGVVINGNYVKQWVYAYPKESDNDSNESST